MNPRLERSVEGLYTVRREEQDALGVLQNAEEDRDQFVSLELMQRALLKEDVRLVQEQDCVPLCAHFQNVSE